ncbi:MAG: hypothetical protein AABW65_01730 [Nanoarchaeota archaeon]
MESIINKIFSRKIDEDVHREFLKFGKGVFENKYLINGKKQKERWNIKTGAEFANFLVKKCLEKTSEKIEVSGIIIATFNIRDKAEFSIEKIKQFMGVKKAVLNTETTPEKILSLMKEYPKAFYALSFSTKNFQLKIKARAPKGAKPAPGREKEISPDFCSLKTNDSEIIKDLFFDAPNFKEANIKHILTISEIAIPEKISDPVQIREQSKRKGKITRIAVIDGKENRSEAEFFA